MSKQEAINRTEYSETELIYLGLVAMKVRMKEARNNSTDSESWDHYDALVKAYDAMEIEYKAKVDKETK